MNFYQTKSFEAEVKDIDPVQGIITGYFAKFDNVDAHGDVIRKGAFQKSIFERGPGTSKDRIKHLYQHDTNLPLGKIKTLSEDEKGLYFESQIVKTSYGQDVIKLYEAEVINEHSIGFKTIKEQMKDGFNEMTELLLWEGSTVTWGANEEARSTGFKSFLTPELAIKRIDTLEKAIKSGTFTDETFHLLIIQLKQLQQAFADLENSLKNSTQPETTTEENIKPDIEEMEAKNVQAFLNKIALKYAQ